MLFGRNKEIEAPTNTTLTPESRKELMAAAFALRAKRKEPTSPFPMIKGRARVILPVVLSLLSLTPFGVFVYSKAEPAGRIEITGSCKPNSNGRGTHPEMVIIKRGDPGRGNYIISWGRGLEDYFHPSSRVLKEETKISFELNRPPPNQYVRVYEGESPSNPPWKGRELASERIPVCP